MCKFIATRAFDDWSFRQSGPKGRGKPPGADLETTKRKVPAEDAQPSSSSSDPTRRTTTDVDGDTNPISEGIDDLRPTKFSEADHATTDESPDAVVRRRWAWQRQQRQRQQEAGVYQHDPILLFLGLRIFLKMSSQAIAAL